MNKKPHEQKTSAEAEHRLERISLYPLKLDEIVRDVLKIPPPPKKANASHPDTRKSQKLRAELHNLTAL